MWGNGRPRCSLKLGPHYAAWAEVSRTWWGRARRRYGLADLPEGLIRPSPVEHNISDLSALQAQLRPLIGLQGEADRERRSTGIELRPAVLVLPDLCVRVFVLQLDKVPSRAAERDKLIRWRLEQEAFFPLEGTKVVSQLFGTRTVLAVGIRETVLRQYEAVCEAVGLEAVDVEVASLSLCNVFAREIPTDAPVAWLGLLDGGLTLIIFHAGLPTFVRTKTQSHPLLEGVLHDVTRSLAFYAETHPEGAPQRLVLFSEEPEQELGSAIATELGLQVVQVGWDGIRHAEWAPTDKTTSVRVLPAVAGLLG